MQIIPNILRMHLVKKRIKKNFRRKLGYELNLNNPQSYCEKVQWLKLNYLAHDPLILQCADKYRVREYIKEQNLENILVELYGSWDKAENISWKALPDSFVLKLNNGSGREYLWFIPNKSSVNEKVTEKGINSVLRRKHGHGYKNGEFHYSKIPPKIVAEEYLKENDRDIKDYKFYCFNGEIAFLSVEQDRWKTEHVREYYDTSFNVHSVKFFDDVKSPVRPFVKPKNFEIMVEVAKLLSKGHPHVRVDLYNINGKIYFGELTFSTQSGYLKWDPLELDFEYGKLIDLDIAKSFLRSKQIGL